MATMLGNIALSGIALAHQACYAHPVTKTFVPLSPPYIINSQGEPGTTEDEFSFGAFVYDKVKLYNILPIELQPNVDYKIEIEGTPGTIVNVTYGDFNNNLVLLEERCSERFVIPDNVTDEEEGMPQIGRKTFEKILIEGTEPQRRTYWIPLNFIDLMTGAQLKAVAIPTPPREGNFIGKFIDVPLIECSTCGTEGEIDCSSCNGTGSIDVEQVDENGAIILDENDEPIIITMPCEECGGDGKVDCPNCTPTANYSLDVTVSEDSLINSITFSNWIKDEPLPTSPNSRQYDYLEQHRITKDSVVLLAETNTKTLNLTQGSKIVAWGTSENPEDDFEVTVTPIKNDDNTSENPCLTADTLITMANGCKKRIDSIEIGEYVKTPKGISRVHKVIRDLYYHQYVEYEFEDGTIVKEVHVHPFYNVEHDYYRCLRAWDIGDHAVNENNEPVKLIRKTIVPERTQQFSIWTEEGSYYANGLLSGEITKNKKLLQEMPIEEIMDLAESLDCAMLTSLLQME